MNRAGRSAWALNAVRAKAAGEQKETGFAAGLSTENARRRARRLRATDAETVELNKGDSASYRADVPHEIRNLSRSESLAFLVVIYQ